MIDETSIGPRTIEESPVKELPQRLDALVVLGKNWSNKKDLPKVPQEGTEIFLSDDSARSTIAAAELYMMGLTDRIIFSTGHTAGEMYPSEAKAMALYLRHFYTEEEIPDNAITLEEVSIDTPGNAEEVYKMLQKQNFQRVGLLTVDYHLRRALKLFENYDMDVDDKFSAEDILQKRGFDTRRPLSKVVRENTLEFVLNSLLIIDKKGVIPRKVTTHIRK